MLTPIWMPLIGWLVLALVMLALWARQRTTRNAGWVDVAWTFGVGGLGVLYALTQPGWLPRRVLVGTLIGLWALRLGSHLYQRVGSEPEDGRYARMRSAKGADIDRWLFWFFQAQALMALVLSLPFFFLTRSGLEGWHGWDGLAVGLWVVSVVGEGLADRQLKAWRQSAHGKGKTCRVGLWRYSRHPNYFFEWVHWLVYPVLAIGMSGGSWLWLAPLGMFVLIRYVTGIPPTEEQSLKSRGEDYRAYQRTTNAFFPGPPRPGAQPIHTTP
ncbi:MAG TPA: DUF1295 domain-containing protein [Planctomycetota bacterium]|nr:DUF1295 domain-containing protein [Planctomycetota bacterium]HRV79980.1 DUF1295 domain-containing protein [Planctomycetota bacterium]